jgi:hypothetical protein
MLPLFVVQTMLREFPEGCDARHLARLCVCEVTRPGRGSGRLSARHFCNLAERRRTRSYLGDRLLILMQMSWDADFAGLPPGQAAGRAQAQDAGRRPQEKRPAVLLAFVTSTSALD